MKTLRYFPNRRGDDRVRQEALRLSSEQEHRCYTRSLNAVRLNQEAEFAQKHFDVPAIGSRRPNLREYWRAV